MDSWNEKATDVVAEARGASRWMGVLGLYDALMALGIVFLTMLFVMGGGVFLIPFSLVGFVFFSYRAFHQLGAARQIRIGIERHDGAALAAGFGHLRKFLIVMFAINLGVLVFGGGS